MCVCVVMMIDEKRARLTPPEKCVNNGMRKNSSGVSPANQKRTGFTKEQTFLG